MAYFYLTEVARFAYEVSVKPAPADESVALVHRGTPDGPVLEKTELKKQGEGVFALDLSKRKLEDSPLFVEFRFKKEKRVVSQVLAIALADPVPGACAADPAAAEKGDSVKLSVTAWTARTFDKPGEPQDRKEEQAERIASSVKDAVKWRVEDKDLASKGETVQLEIQDEHIGKKLPVEAFLGETPPGRAKTEVDCRVPVKIVLKDLSDAALEQTPCVVSVSGETQEAKTDETGLLRFRVSKTPVRAKLRVDNAPPTLDVDIPVFVGALPGADTKRGQQARLRNLGYFFGRLAEVDDTEGSDDEDPQAFASAVEEFQCDNGLSVSGDCDGATQAKLQELHGS